MSADLDKIYDAIVVNGNRLTAIEATQAERHMQNQTDMRKLHKTIANVVALKTQAFYQWFFIGGIFIGIVSLFIRNL